MKYNGIVPKRYEDLSSLPGVGDYTAKAIMSIAYKKKVIGIDVNIKRVTSRVFGLYSHNIKKINQKLSALIPENRSDDFMQALYIRLSWGEFIFIDEFFLHILNFLYLE